MSGETDQPDSLDELSGDLRAAIECLKWRQLPEASLQRALDRAGHFGLPVRRTAHGVKQKAALGFAAAAAVCIALGLWMLRPSDLWADVVKTVQGKPWIHGTLPGDKPGQSRDFWISTSRAIGGARSEEEISFFDDRLRIIYQYEPQKKILYRLPASAKDLAQLLETLQGLFRGDAELRSEFSGLILKDQQRTQTEKVGRKWDEYELHFQIPSRPDADLRMTFLVDALTRLPHSMTMKEVGGESVEWTFDYPENGPADIYALGVPKDAKLVDRVPTGDMSRILAAIQAGRDRFGGFHGIAIRNSSSDVSSGPGQPFPVAYLVWKKGNRWRVEVGMPSPEFVSKRIPPNKDETEWVREGCKKGFFRTENVCDGKAVYGGDNFALVATADQADSSCADAMRAMPSTWCYPITFNPPNERTEEVVNLNPSEGPPNTILVTSRVVDMRGHDPARTLPFNRFWLDPLRGYAVAREDSLHAEPTVKPPTDGDFQSLMDQWEQTPSGVWYPTRVGSGSIKELKQKKGIWYHFFLNFPADLPDDLFKPGKRTALTDLYPVGS